MFVYIACLLLVVTSSTKQKDESKGKSKCLVEDVLSIYNDIDIIISVNDPLYESTRLHPQFASRRGTIQERDNVFQPTLIVEPKSEKEIQDIVRFASKCDYKISVRSGGHSYSGFSSCNGLLNGKCIQIDMKYFDKIIYNKDDSQIITSIIVSSGVKLGDLYASNTANNVTIMGGACDSVAAGGHYQSSSQGIWTRSLGLGMDWIFRIKLVTADGKIKNVYKNSQNKDDKDLFWAILGGSPGSWGVIIEYEFIPIHDEDYPYSSIYQYTDIYSDELMRDLVPLYFDMLSSDYYEMASDLIVYLGIYSLGDDSNNHGIAMLFAWTGHNFGDINNIIPNHDKTWYQELVEPFKDLFNSPSSRMNEELSPLSVLQLASARDGGNYPFRYYNIETGYKYDTLNIDNTLKGEWIESIISLLSNSKNTDNLQLSFHFMTFNVPYDNYRVNDDITINHDPLQNAASYPLRDVPLQIDASMRFGGDGDEYDIDQASKAKEVANDLKDILTANQIKTNINSFAYSDKSVGEYLNDPEFDAFFPERNDVFEKLKEIKTRVDCKNIFDGAVTIPINDDE